MSTAPKLVLKPGGEDKEMLKTIGEGLSLPSEMRGRPKAGIEPLVEETLVWIRTVLRERWIPEHPERKLLAIPACVEGQDAFVWTWDAMRIVVTRRRVHVIASLPAKANDAAAAFAFATELLRVDALDPAAWTVRPFAGLVLGYRDVEFARSWDETLLFLTDGRAVKYSVLKYRNRVSQPKGREENSHHPWFPTA